MGILQTYYADWDTAVEYVCEEHTHPLEDTYWKTRVCIYIRDEEKEAYLLDSNSVHRAPHEIFLYFCYIYVKTMSYYT